MFCELHVDRLLEDLGREREQGDRLEVLELSGVSRGLLQEGLHLHVFSFLLEGG